MLYYCVQSSDYLRCVDILNHKIMPLIRLLIIQKCPMRKQTLSQEFRLNNIKSLKGLVNYHSPIVFIFIYIYSPRGLVITTVLILFILFLLLKYSLMFDTINLYIRPILCTTPKMLQYRESLIFGNLKDNLALQYSSCGAILLFSVFTQLKSRFLGIYVLSTRIFQYDV